MASEYTNYFNLDLYTDSDKPNLRDQYNGAMQKVDEQMHTNAVNITSATNAANNAVSQASTNAKAISDMDTAYKAADTALSNRVTANETAISDMGTAYKAADTALSNRVTANETSISDIDKKIADLQAAASASSVDPFDGRKLVTIGDSWLEGYSSVGSTTPWGDTLRSLAGVSTSDYSSYYQGGSGFVTASSGNSFQTLATNAANAISSSDKVTVCVVGGINDRSASHSNAYNGAYNVVRSLRDKGDVEVYVFPMALVGRFISSASMDIKNALASGAAAAGAHVYSDCYDWLYDTESWHADSYHPNTAGQTAFANFMYAAMRGSVIDMHNGNASISGANGFTLNSGSYVRRSGTICSGYIGTTGSPTDGTPFFSMSKGYSPGSIFSFYTNSSGALKPMNLKDVDSDHVGFAPSYGDASQVYSTPSWPIEDA